MTDTPVLTPLEERTVDFYGDAIIAFALNVGGQREIYVPLRPLCDYLGLSWNAQRERIHRDPVLDEALRFARITRANSSGGDPNVLCLPLEFLPGWLFGVSTNRVRPELQEKILRYRRECFRVLWRAFQAEALAVVQQQQPTDVARSSTAGADLVHLRELGLAVAQLADQQLALEQQVHTRLDRAALVIKDIERRLSDVEEQTGPDAYITNEQAAHLSTEIKALAQLLATQDRTKNHYQGVFSELYRRFGVSSYKLVSREQYPAVLAFLDTWRKDLGTSNEQGSDTTS
ncbi:MAG: ORF6C domain-containing protein [Chloroflexota bacterium]|nr:ORF6C domain-containing protein [Chloroflexota bacterium]